MKKPRKSPPRKSQIESERKLDEELEESFPASDPPANSGQKTRDERNRRDAAKKDVLKKPE